MLIAAPFTIPTKWKQTPNSSSDECANKMWPMLLMEHRLARTRDTVLLRATKCLTLKPLRQVKEVRHEGPCVAQSPL
jgi:hypothetical protein